MISIVYNDEGKAFFIKDRKSVNQIIRNSNYDIEYVQNAPESIVVLNEKVIEVNNLLSAVVRLFPEMYHTLPKDCDGAEIIGIKIRPINIKQKKGAKTNGKSK